LLPPAGWGTGNKMKKGASLRRDGALLWFVLLFSAKFRRTFRKIFRKIRLTRMLNVNGCPAYTYKFGSLFAKFQVLFFSAKFRLVGEISPRLIQITTFYTTS